MIPVGFQWESEPSRAEEILEEIIEDISRQASGLTCRAKAKPRGIIFIAISATLA